ncbi:MAG: site-2 protease family protein [Clostridia bacterium]|jgi:stage IV sporulation protein FB|nr:sporulation protein IVFB related protein predicted metallopeptidase [Clostridium sp. CAG:571]HJJ06705.1 site-2 protease family protein [Clostridiaceae bacterium]HJJ13776.1 site-2 protease family protein [Clostridiaceae bacterium]
MQIKVDLKIFIAILIFLLTEQLNIYIVFMLFAIIHELGHVLTGIILGFKPKNIEVLPIGISACFYMQCDDYNKKINYANRFVLKKVIISCAGPITNFIIAIIFYFFDFSIFNISREFIIYTNLIIGIFNLIPIYPLDGGRIIKNILHIKIGLKESYKYTKIIANLSIIILTIFSSMAILYLKNISIVLILIYLWGIVIIQNKKYESKMNIYKMLEKNEV